MGRNTKPIDSSDERDAIPVTVRVSKDVLQWVERNCGPGRAFTTRTAAVEHALRKLREDGQRAGEIRKPLLQ
jgi:hypothetical protein